MIRNMNGRKNKEGEHRYEFHIERKLRSKYQIEDSFFAQQGNVIFADFVAVRQFVHNLNSKRDPRMHVYPGEVNAAGLLEEVYHYVFREYEKQINANVFSHAYEHIVKVFGDEKTTRFFYDFTDKFPPSDVYKGEISISNYLNENKQGKSNVLRVLEEVIMVFFANFNPANKKLKELFDEQYLSSPTLFRRIIDELEDFFEEQPPFGPDNQDLFSMFKTPILNYPDDISMQVDYIMDRWKTIIPESVLTTLLRGKDLLKEDVTFDTTGGGGMPTIAPKYKGLADNAGMFSIGKSGYKYAEDAEKDYEEIEAFTPDVHWMPSVVMIAKNTYVWLDQLSKKYQREIRRLDQIPDEELDILRKWNFTGLWLIGLWERSEASRRIKHIMGNVDAVSSAYSLYDYQIAHDLGGEEAYNNLNERAKARSLRLASDMVPNHTGIYSRWVKEHPDFFIQSTQPPFPGYTFSGENLSQDDRYDIRLEDGYYRKTDAAVVFQWKDNHTGQVRYMYHGNDGTNMPWNDTAQLDMLKHEVRQAVIDKIFDVARRFSIIRFDAAMTLAKKHFARLWYPRPGTGGDIPSRADHALTQKQFDELFPVEFWREVVDRMNREMPETLLLAEAFWFMEGYFVRTLGMHRVYNSAFMHMLKNEENEKYRDLITNTLEFEPEILKRYVNFMSNPDEETAIRQFGTDDKYFGVCILMNTLPGLPMFAHGQIEGYTEKYGMEYQRAYYNEDPHPWLVAKHEKEVFPLTRKRYLFSEVDNFNIFDFIDGYGNINENVIAYTNRHAEERALILYNNKYEQASGRIMFSAPKLTRNSSGKKETVSVNLAQALNIKNHDNVFYRFREHISGLEYLRKGSDFHNDGLQWNLNGFEYRVFWDFKEFTDNSGEYEKLMWRVTSGVHSIDDAMEQMRLQPLHESFQSIFAEDLINFMTNRVQEESPSKSDKLGYTLLEARYEDFISKTKEYFNLEDLQPDVAADTFMRRVKSVESAFNFIYKGKEERKEFVSGLGISDIEQLLTIGSRASYRNNMFILMAWFALDALYRSIDEETMEYLDRKMHLQWPLQNLLQRAGKGNDAIMRDIALLKLLLSQKILLFDFSDLNFDKPGKLKAQKTIISDKKTKLALNMLADEHILTFIGVHQYEGVKYFSKESYEEITDWLFTVSLLRYFNLLDDTMTRGEKERLEMLLRENIAFLLRARKVSDMAGYELDKLMNLLQQR